MSLHSAQRQYDNLVEPSSDEQWLAETADEIRAAMTEAQMREAIADDAGNNGCDWLFEAVAHYLVSRDAIYLAQRIEKRANEIVKARARDLAEDEAVRIARMTADFGGES